MKAPKDEPIRLGGSPAAVEVPVADPWEAAYWRKMAEFAEETCRSSKLLARAERAEAVNQRLRAQLRALAEAVEIYLNADLPGETELRALDLAERYSQTLLYDIAARDSTDPVEAAPRFEPAKDFDGDAIYLNRNGVVCWESQVSEIPDYWQRLYVVAALDSTQPDTPAHASPHCACGVNDAGQRHVDPICREH